MVAPSRTCDVSTCWECGNETPTTMTATLRLTDGAPRHFELRPACYRARYLPLLDDAAGRDGPPALAVPARTHRSRAHPGGRGAP